MAEIEKLTPFNEFWAATVGHLAHLADGETPSREYLRGRASWNAALEAAAACDFTMRTVACPDEHYAEVAYSAVQSAIEGKSAAILRLKEDPDGK